MITTILSPLDGSPVAESVLPYLLSLSKGLKASVVFAYVVAPDQLRAESPEHRSSLDQLQQSAEAAIRDYLEEKAGPFRNEGVTATTTVLYGGDGPADTLLEYEQQQVLDLVALATHGRSGLQRMFLGSVADRLVQRARTPLFLVRPGTEAAEAATPMQSLVVPLDGSDLAANALPLVEDLAKALGLPVMLLRILPEGPPYSAGSQFYPYPADLLQYAELAALRDLKATGDGLRSRGVTVQWEVRFGDPGPAIIEYAARTPGAVTVIASHGRSGPGRWPLGSVASKILRASTNPVVVVRPTAHDANS